MPNEDPAVTQAKQLWKDKQQKEAMLVLVKRINELNLMLAHQTGPGARPVIATSDREWGRAILGSLLIIALIIALLVLLG